MSGDSKTVIVTGATGLLGRQVAKAFSFWPGANWTVKGTGFSRAGNGNESVKLDLQDAAQVERVLNEIRPQAVIHCAANRFPDKVDKDPEGTRVLNVEASRNLAKLCADRDVFLIYISTDYVFSGKPGEAPYEADAATGPTNLYGQTKLDGEAAVLGEYKAAGKEGLGVVLRVPVLYGEADKPEDSAVNILTETVRKAAQNGAKEVSMDHWALRFPTNTADVGRVCRDVTDYYLGTTDKSALPKILQFSSEDKYTKYEMCQLFGEIMGLPIDKIKPNTEGNDPNASVQRPYDCHLSTKALRDLGIDVSTEDFVGWWRREMRAFRH